MKVSTPPFGNQKDKIVFSGQVISTSGNPIPKIKVVLSEPLLRGKKWLADVVTNSKGNYELTLDALPGKAAYVLEVVDSEGKPLASSDQLFNPGPAVIRELTVSDSKYKGKSTFTLREPLLNSYFLQLTTAIDKKPISAEDIQFVATQTGVDTTDTFHWLRSKEMEAETKIPAEAFYGLFKQGFPTDAENLFAKKGAEIKEALIQAANANLISDDTAARADKIVAQWNDHVVRKALAEAPAKTDASFTQLVCTAVKNKKMQKKVLTAYLTHDGPVQEFWEKLPAITGDPASAGSIQTALKLGVISGNQPEMITELFKKHNESGNILHDLAAMNSSDWVTFVNDLSKRKKKSVVPSCISGTTEKDRVEKYAAQMTQRLEVNFPTQSFFGKLAKQKPGQIAFAAQDDMVKFFKNNPSFDITGTPTISMLTESATPFNFDGIGNVNQLVSDLQSAQRLSAYTSDFNAKIALKNKGLDNAYQIVRIPEKDFVISHTSVFGSDEAARKVYKQAEKHYMNSAMIWAMTHPNIAFGTGSTPLNIADPTLSTLFGTLDTCRCDECTSVYSPAAYFTDILKFLQSRTPAVYHELIRRRPDLVHINLTCENTNRPIPYIDLVNELLEKSVLSHKNTPVTLPGSCQTTWQANELAANPEHINDEAYAELKNAVYPGVLPFNLPLEESRIYLAHLGAEKHQLMTMFFAGSKEDAFNEFNIHSERLKISGQEGKILSGESAGDLSHDTGLWNFYGFNKSKGYTPLIDPVDSSGKIAGGSWKSALTSRIDVFLQQTRITYQDMLSLLLCNTINPVNGTDPRGNEVRAIGIVSRNNDHDCCALNNLALSGVTTLHLQKIHRFLRLWRKLGWSMYELDMAATAFNLTFTKSIKLNKTDLTKIFQTDYLLKQLNLPVEQILTCWSTISTVSYPDYSMGNNAATISLFEKLFCNKSVIRPVDTEFAHPLTLPGTLDEHAATIQAALQISNEEFIALKGTKTALSITNLSFLYRNVLLSRKLKLKVKDFLSLKNLINAGKDPFSSPDSLYRFLGMADTIKSSGFSIDQLNYLLNHQLPAEPSTIPADSDISSFLSELRAALRTIETATAQEQRDLLVRKFSEKLHISLIACDLLLNKYLMGIQHPGKYVVEDFRSDIFFQTDFLKTHIDRTNPLKPFEFEPVFVSFSKTQGSTSVPKHELIRNYSLIKTTDTGANLVSVPALFKNYIRLDKIATVINRLKLSDADLETILAYCAAMNCTDLAKLPVEAATGDFVRFETLISLIRARDLMPAGSPGFFELILHAINTPDKTKWIDGLVARTLWDRHTIEELVGNGHDNKPGILNVSFPAGFVNGDIILQIKKCMSMVNKIGLDVSMIHDAIGTDPDSRVSNALKNAARAKYDEAQWLKLAKPLRDELREKQREALVAYVIAHADLGSNERWKNSDELYEYLLIDVEMKPISMTSRIKQAICSVQLFVDRVLMNLEHPNSDPAAEPLMLSGDQVEEWNKWRKLYRVWEANRKIFLYPENWLEPELRDDKSPFFKELETQLKQNELTNENIEDAFHIYLEKLDEVARLEVVGLFHQKEEDNTDIVHVFARTPSNPHKYFHRTLEHKEWSAWNKLEIDVDGDHLVPVIFNRKLCLFWLFFTQETDEVSSSINAQSTYTAPDRKWKVQVAWSEFRKKSWTAKRLSKSFITTLSFNNSADLEMARSGCWLSARIFPDKLMLQLDGTIHGGAKLIFDGNNAFVFNNTNNDPSPTTLTIPPITGSGNMVPVRQVIGEAAQTFQMLEAVTENPPLKIESQGLNSISRQWYPLGFEKLILGRTGEGIFRIVVPSNEHEPPYSDFFFQDKKNTFYVEHTIQNLVFLNLLIVPGINSDQFIYLESSTPTTTQVKDCFTFSTFYHAHIKTFIKELYKLGIDGLLKRELQTQGDSIQFKTNYVPTDLVANTSPTDEVDFSYGSTYSQYNWELFFHVPMLIACRLKDDQRFEEARKWFHYIFNPSTSEGGGKERFWQFRPFYEEAGTKIETLNDLLENRSELDSQVEKWTKDPFKPHVIARMRQIAYMKNVVMKYLDNLIAWGDNLFQRDTIEAINEATNLYIQAAKILGERPRQIPPRAKHGDASFELIKDNLDSFSNAMVNIETLIAPSATPSAGISSGSSSALGQMFFFCVPANDNLLKYWDTVADRLFKIRHSMNIEGITRTLPLFEPPIDPAMLVRAAAAGMNLNSILGDMQAALPNYRFSFILLKAIEFANEVKNLGAALLQALEKRDAEAFALLRSAHEQKLLDAVLFIKEQQVDDAKKQLESLIRSKEIVQLKYDYYSSRQDLNDFEKQQLDSIQQGMRFSKIQGALSTIGGVLAAIPNLKVGVPTSMGATWGGDNLGALMNAISTGVGIFAALNNAQGTMAGLKGGYERRGDDWNFQTDSAFVELKQLDKQIISGEIKLAIAGMELENQKLQIENNREDDEFMRSKFTNQQLYDWMIGQLSTVYFQSYQLAYNLAKKAEKCYQYELGEYNNTSFIQFGYWDSLKKGLLSAEKLQYDLRRMESSYYDKNVRELELTKHVSLMLLNPQVILDLREKGTSFFVIPEAMFDLDFQGHYFRRIKSIAVSIPCIAGPYTTINATLRLLNHTIRINSNMDPASGKYLCLDYANDNRFRYINTPQYSIATSNAQNDSGGFELNFHDERYLPFEGCGVISEWQLELSTDQDFRMFDYNTISDVIMTMRYTAKESTAANFKQNVSRDLRDLIKNSLPPNGLELKRMFSMKHEFSSEWHKFLFPPVTGSDQILSMTLQKEHFPFFTKERDIKVTKIELLMNAPRTGAYEMIFSANDKAIISKVIQFHASATYSNMMEAILPETIETTLPETATGVSLQEMNVFAPVSFNFGQKTNGADPEEISDLFVVMHYMLGD